MLPNKQESLKLLQKHVKEHYQLLHAKMVAAAMEAWANKLNENTELWYTTGLLHDIDYFEFPNEHPAKSLQWFREWGYPQELIHAVEAHAFGYNDFKTEPETQMAAALIACDEMSGLIYAYSLMRPEKMKGMEVKGVLKRMKDKGFAAKINRHEIKYGVEKFANMSSGQEVDINVHIKLLIETFNKMQEFNT